MLEVLGLTVAEEIGLGALIGTADVLMPELLVAEAIAIAGIFIFRQIRKHQQEKQSQPEMPNQDDDQPPQLPDGFDDEIIEENKQVDSQVDRELLQEGLIENKEQQRELQQELEREQRLDVLRQEMGVETPEMSLYPAGLVAEIQRLEREEEQMLFRMQSPGEDPSQDDPDPNGGNNGGNGGGNGGGNNDPDSEPDDEIANPYNDNPNRNINPHENPFKQILKDSAQRIAGQYANQLLKEKDDDKKHAENKISDEEYERLKAENEQIKNQLETQKQLLDILDAVGMNEITDEESLVQLEKIEQDIKEMTQKQVKVGDIFAQDAVTF